MTFLPKIVESGIAASQLRQVLECKMAWFDSLARENSAVTLIHPLIARMNVSDEYAAKIAGDAHRVLDFMRNIYCRERGQQKNDLSALCQHIASDIPSYPNITPGGVVQSRPFFARSMASFQDAWRDCVLDAVSPIKFTAIQAFANLRIVPGNVSEDLAARPYATTTLHSDIWIGEPIDSINGWMALGGDIKNNFIQFFDSSPGFIADHFSHERRYDSVLSKLEAAGISFSPIHESISKNVLYLFDCLIPHRTCIVAGGARLSIDGRFRSGALVSPSCVGPVNLEGIQALRDQYRDL